MGDRSVDAGKQFGHAPSNQDTASKPSNKPDANGRQPTGTLKDYREDDGPSARPQTHQKPPAGGGATMASAQRVTNERDDRDQAVHSSTHGRTDSWVAARDSRNWTPPRARSPSPTSKTGPIVADVWIAARDGRDWGTPPQPSPPSSALSLDDRQRPRREARPPKTQRGSPVYNPYRGPGTDSHAPPMALKTTGKRKREASVEAERRRDDRRNDLAAFEHDASSRHYAPKPQHRDSKP